jgi:hypothetical protein
LPPGQIRPGFQLALRQQVGAGSPLATNVLELHPFERPAYDDHDIHSWRKEVSGRAECFANEPFRAVANDGVAYPARCDDPESSFPIHGPCVEQQDEVGEHRFSAPALRGLELEPLLDSLRGRKAIDGARTRHYFL